MFALFNRLRSQERSGGKVYVGAVAVWIIDAWELLTKGQYPVFRQAIFDILTAEKPPNPRQQRTWGKHRWLRHRTSRGKFKRALRYMISALSEAIVNLGWPTDIVTGRTKKKAPVCADVPIPYKRAEFIRISRGGDKTTLGSETVIDSLVPIHDAEMNVGSQRVIEMNGDCVTNPTSKSWCDLDGVLLVVNDMILASGTSSANAIDHVLETNPGKPAKIIFACVYALKDGIRLLQKRFPGIIVICGFVANKLNPDTFYGEDPDIGDGGAVDCDNEDRPKPKEQKPRSPSGYRVLAAGAASTKHRKQTKKR